MLYATFTGIKQDEDLTHAVAIGLEVRSLEGVQAQETSAWTYCLEQHLHGVLGLSNLLLSMVGLKPHKLQLNCLLSAAHQMLDQLQNVRRVRTLEPADPEPVDFVDLIDEVLFLVEASTDKAGMPIRKPGVEINSSIGKSYVPTVLGNRDKLQQLAYNIVHNACRYTLSGTVTISGTHDREKSLYQFTVKDTGCGIPKEFQASSLQPAPAPRARVPARCMQGPGFGLAAAAALAEEAGLGLALESEVGRGTEIVVTLRCTDEKPGISPISEAVFSLDQEVPFSRMYSTDRVGRTRPLVLSVDDDEINQEVIRQSLGDDYDLHCCMDGQSALDWLELNKNNLPDVILLDIQMPGMTGYEVCRRIRENYNESLWELPITLLSAKAPASAVAMEGFQSGSTDFMAKPFDQDLLRKKVSLSLDMKRSLPISPKNRRQASKPNMPSRKEAAVLLREHEEHVQSLEAQMADQAQEIAMLQEELRKAREPPFSQDLRARSSSPETRQKIRKQHVEEEHLMSELAGMRQRNMQVAKRLLLQNQHLHRIQCAEEAQVDVDPGEDDFFGCEALRKQISEFNPFEAEDDAAPDMPEKFAAMCDWNTPPPSPILAKSST